jgi:hypothetical protein
MIFPRIVISLYLLFEHDLFGKPACTFADHALSEYPAQDRCGRENRRSSHATATAPVSSSTALAAADFSWIDAIASSARPALSVKTSPTTRGTVKPLSVAR